MTQKELFFELDKQIVEWITQTINDMLINKSNLTHKDIGEGLRAFKLKISEQLPTRSKYHKLIKNDTQITMFQLAKGIKKSNMLNVTLESTKKIIYDIFLFGYIVPSPDVYMRYLTQEIFDRL